MSFLSKGVIISGASGGIARATADVLSKKGYSLCLLSRNYESNQAYLNQLKKVNESQQFCTFKCDITDQKNVQQCIKEAVNVIGPPIGLVNAAAINKDGLFLTTSLQTMTDLFSTNVMGTMILTQSILPYMMKQKRGSIVTIGSIVGEDGNIGQTVYSSTKSALIGFTKSLSKEMARYNIRCNLIEPGFIDTVLTQNLSDQVKSKVKEMIPCRRFGNADEIANTIEFLISEQSSYINGSILRIDGGLHL